MEAIDLTGRRGLVVGVANADSLAWSAARHLRNAGAELALTCYNEKARPFVAPTRATPGIAHFDELLDEAARRSPQRRTVEGCEVGRVALLLASPYASAITGEVVHVDAGFHVEGMVFH